jgi:hypothetical protein
VQTPALILLAAFVGVPHALYAQPTEGTPAGRFFDVTVGLGINAHVASAVADYVNQVALPWPEQKADIITSAPEVYAVCELQISDDWSVGAEYALLLKSHAVDDRSGYARSNFSYQVHMPSVLVHRLLFGEGYRVKAGGGVGYHFCLFQQEFQPYGNEEALRTSGLSLKLEAVGNTKFDESFYGSIGFDLRWDFLGRLERRVTATTSGRTVELPSMNFFNAGIKLGITFQLN